MHNQLDRPTQEEPGRQPLALAGQVIPSDLFHQVAALFPLLAGEEYQALLLDIQRQGLLMPLWRFQGQIIDGRNRYLACQQLGIEPTYREWSGNGSLVTFVVGLNLTRRHLNSSQKAMIALEIETHLAQEAHQRQQDQGQHGKEGGRGHRKAAQTLRSKVTEGFAWSAQQAGTLVGVGATYVKQAKKIAEQAPELKAVVLAGTLDLSAARVIAPLPATQRAVVIARLARGEGKTAKAAVLDLKKEAVAAQTIAAPTKPVVSLAPYQTWLPSQPPCDLLLTDPPYATDVEDIDAFARTWLPLALAKVKVSGRAYVCIGAYPRELRAYLTVPVPAHLSLHNVLVWTYKNTLGPHPLHAYKQNWQAILYFAGREAPPLECPLLVEQFAVQEINAPDGRVGNRVHPWQKPDALAERLIRHSTRPGEVVLDCFVGTGTFVLAAHRLDRKAVGCEQSEAMLALAEKRGCARA